MQRFSPAGLLLSAVLGLGVGCMSRPAPGSAPMSAIRTLRPVDFTAQGDSVAAPVEAGWRAIELDVQEAQSKEPSPLSLVLVLQRAAQGHPELQMALERVAIARAELLAAQVEWLPTLQVGGGYTKHEGNLQATEGIIGPVSRGAGRLGVGAVAQLDLAQAMFGVRALEHGMAAESAAQNRALHDVMLQAALAYEDLAFAQAKQALATEAQRAAAELSSLAAAFVVGGQGLSSDAARAEVELARREGDFVLSEQGVAHASTRLATILRWDASTPLEAQEGSAPLDLIPAGATLDELTDRALAARPELSELRSRVAATQAREEEAQRGPWYPTFELGVNGGLLGGGRGSHFSNFEESGDLTLSVGWSLSHLGLGDRAALERAGAETRLEQARLRGALDHVAADVAIAWTSLEQSRRVINHAGRALVLAKQSLELNMVRIRAGEGLPLEALQAMQAQASSEMELARAFADHNRAQLQLLWAVGEPLR